MTAKDRQAAKCRDLEKAIACVIGGLGFSTTIVYWGLPALADLLIFIGG